MSRFYSHLNSASFILNLYKGEMPFAIFLKQYFAKGKKYGSKDRKQISSLCFNYFRVNNVLLNDNIEEQLLIATFLCEQNSNPILAVIKPEWNERINLNLSEKLLLLKDSISQNPFFKLIDFVSNKLDKTAFSNSIVIQPDLFIRLRNQGNKVVDTLTENNISFAKISSHTLAMSNGSKMPETIIANKDYVVQDFSSQQVGSIVRQYVHIQNDNTKVWDCCAASGGKSIMLHDLGFECQLFVSDIRESILVNLTQRFETAGITKYTKFIADLTAANIKTPVSKFDIIIADVPCSGSGTWGRTPEQLNYFTENNIKTYTARQNLIAKNLSNYLSPNGILVYITCSVFEAENESVVNNILNNGFEEVYSQYILGYEHKADSMYISVLQKSK